jgi:hypothetical protein
MDVLIWVALIAAAIGASVWSYRRKRKRREELATVARRLGLAYSAEDDAGCLGLPFALLQRGDDRGAENVLSGTWQGVPVREFDYWYEVESRDANGHTTRTTYRFSCATTEVDAAMSPLTLGRENVFTRLADSLGLADIEFELDEFNRAFTVKCEDRKFANDFVDQRMMHWLLGTDADYSYEVGGRWLLVSSKRRPPAELIPLLGTLKRFREQIPSVVYDLYGPRASG